MINALVGLIALTLFIVILGFVFCCKKCRTPHHDDCWRYARRCATYGCGGRRAMRA